MLAQSISKKVTQIIGLSGGIVGIVAHVIVWSHRAGSRNFFQKVADVIRILM